MNTLCGSLFSVKFTTLNCQKIHFSWYRNYHTTLFMIWELLYCLFQKMQCHYTWVITPRLSWNIANEVIWSKELSICTGHAKWALYSTDYRPVVQLQTPCTLLPNVSSDLIRHAGWLKHQDQGLCCMFSLVKGIQKLKYSFHLLWIWLLHWYTTGLETRRLKNATNCDRHRTSAREFA